LVTKHAYLYPPQTWRVNQNSNPSPTYILPLPEGGGGLRRGWENIKTLPNWLAITI